LADAAALATAFGRVLRGAGVPAPVDSVLTFTEALGTVGVDARDSVYWAGRATLVHRPEDIATYDRAFAAFWEQRVALGGAEPEAEPIHLTIAVDDGLEDDAGTDDDSVEATEEPDITLRFSRTEVLRHRDFAAYNATELREAQQLMSDLRLAGSLRRSRRLVRSRRNRGRLDLRRTVRAALRAEGEAVRTLHLEQGTRPRRLILLIDVSGSMEAYARALLRFVHAAVAGRQKVEAFAIGTRLTRMTRELGSRDPDVALRQAGERVLDWSGGTRLGDGLRQFNDEWGVRGLARGAIVVVLSDGWDRGDPAVLGEQMARLSRVAHRIIWVNPLKVTPGYAPLARGMAAALPYIDAFVEGHSLAALQELSDEISR
jgi:uncharacterized protein with von Willebrand factor type A (vWA) domain